MDSENKPKLNDLKISTPSRSEDISSVETGLISIGKLYEKYAEDFKDFCAPKSGGGLSEGTYRDYVSALKKYGASIFVPNDITEYHSSYEIYLPSKFGKGWGKFSKMLTRKLTPDKRSLNGFPFDDFKNAINDAETAEGKDNIAHDLTKAQMKEFVAHTTQDCAVLFQILAYSGARLEQAIKLFKSGKARELSEVVTTESGKQVFRINASEFGDEKKLTNYYYLPMEFAETALNWTPTMVADSYSRKFSIAGDAVNPPKEGEDDKKRKVVSVKTLRKWLANLIINNGVPAEIAGWIEGRKPNKNTSAAAVTWNNYADLDGMAVEAYAKLEPVILSILPINSKFETAEKAKPKPAPSRKKEGVDEDKMRELLLSGMNQKDVAKACGTNATRVNNYVKEHPECRNARNRTRGKAKAQPPAAETKPTKHKVSKDLLKMAVKK